MSNRPAAEQRGFSLLDCEIAILVLSLLTAGVMRLTTDHEQVVRSLEGWTEGREVAFVVPPEDELERLLGVPARLADEGSQRHKPVRERAYDVVLLEADLELAPAGGRASVRLVHRPPAPRPAKGR